MYEHSKVLIMRKAAYRRWLVHGAGVAKPHGLYQLFNNFVLTTPTSFGSPGFLKSYKIHAKFLLIMKCVALVELLFHLMVKNRNCSKPYKKFIGAGIICPYG